MTNDASMTEKFYEAVLTWETNMSTVYFQVCHTLPAPEYNVWRLCLLFLLQKQSDQKITFNNKLTIKRFH